jgi:hypothetical protein
LQQHATQGRYKPFAAVLLFFRLQAGDGASCSAIRFFVFLLFLSLSTVPCL